MGVELVPGTGGPGRRAEGSQCVPGKCTALALVGGVSSLGRVPHMPFAVKVAGREETPSPLSRGWPGLGDGDRGRHSPCRTRRVVPTRSLVLSMPLP